MLTNPMERKTSGKKAEREGGTRIMKVIKRKKQRGSLLLKLAYIVFALVNQQVQINEKSQELADL